MENPPQMVTEADLKRFHELNKQKKEIDLEMNELKKLFHQQFDNRFGKMKKGEIQLGGYKIQRQIRSSVKYKEKETIQKLEELNLGDFIEITKRADTEKLEAAIKLGLVPENDFIDCKKVKSTPSIIIKETFSR